MDRLELANFLESVKDLYPGGISKESLRKCAAERSKLVADTPPTKESHQVLPKILFLSLESEEPDPRNSDPAGALLVAAVEKGLRLNVNEVEVARALDADVLKSRMDSSKASLLVVLGESTARGLGMGDLTRGQLHSLDDREILCSVPLLKAALEPSQKRVFWEDLQKLMQRF